MIKAIIIDDEERARVNLKLLIEEFCPEVRLVAECKNLSEGVKSIRKENPELVFLDIEMPGHSGLELLDFFNDNEINFSIIFTTAYNNYAIQAFKLAAVDYLLKPINPQELIDAIALFEKKKNQLENLITLKNNLEHKDQTKIAVPVSGKIVFLDINEILYLKGEGSYTNIFKTDKTNFLVSRNLKSFEELLENSKNMMRIHKSYIANFQHIVAVSKADGGFVEFSDESQIPVSQEKLTEILELVKYLKR
ncbi:LytR/AlgR family response regulator transcription factor [Chryseobacterium oryctis]|uniref:LytTR family DNA-binding domain-containing protein n=1 Tax=Chryseobacterium oryctis TaxID=2952618 RepID=A0ABT3HMP2_9FLAO|nr:LytTR family DNA-binding domain-containing protein [Chryseobacterium oryctis]MCW3161014.1 LytTR family DNA-binding domain-containing protein [Chryseobacterium oryctis]